MRGRTLFLSLEAPECQLDEELATLHFILIVLPGTITALEKVDPPAAAKRPGGN